MVVVQFSFDVPENRILEFHHYSRTTLKNSWEAASCRFYTAYKTMSERIRGDQVIEKGRITEHLVFDSLEDVRKFFDIKNLNTEQRAAAESYGERFHVTNMQSIILEKP